jgi:hemolysin III
LIGTAVLIALAHGPHALLGASVYGASPSTLFGLSALYHRGHWSPRVRRWLRRLDHSAIFVLIAGTWTPLCLMIDRGRSLVLSVAWGGATLGVLQAVFCPRARTWLVAAGAVLLGWASVPFRRQIAQVAGTTGTALLVAGGVIHTLGAIVYALRRPDPAPFVFGYHEVFHALVVIAAACHFAVVALITHQ